MDAKKVLIPKEISIDEPCLRCIYSPMQYSRSKRKLRENAILPPPNRNRNDVPLSRRNYITGLEVCINRGRGIVMGENQFCGIACFTKADVYQVNGDVDELIRSDVVYAPMHLDEYVDPTIDVYVGDPNVDKGDHAELRYSRCYDKTDVVYTSFRKYAQSLVSKIKMIYLEPE